MPMRINTKFTLLLAATCLVLVGAGCSKKSVSPAATGSSNEAAKAATMRQVTVDVKSLGSYDLKGSVVILEQPENKVRIEGRFSGAATSGRHPVEMRKGTCASIGATVYPLGAANNGESRRPSMKK